MLKIGPTTTLEQLSDFLSGRSMAVCAGLVEDKNSVEVHEVTVEVSGRGGVVAISSPTFLESVVKACNMIGELES